MIFFSKSSKFYVDFENAIELEEDVNNLEDNCVLASSENFRQLWQEHMSSAVNVLKSGPKIADPTKRHDPQLNFFDINGTLA